MHASHVDPRLLIAAFAALVLAVLVALAPSLPVIDLSTSSGGSDAAAPALAAPAAQPGTTPGDPRWVTAPLRPPAF